MGVNRRRSALPGRLALYLLYAAFLVSFWLPAAGTLERAGTPHGTPLRGYEAFALLAEFANPWLLIAAPSVLVLFPLIFFANLALASFPLVDGLLGARAYPCVAVLAAAGVVAAIALPENLVEPRRIGFYVWVGSLAAMSVVLAAMGACWYICESGDER